MRRAAQGLRWLGVNVLVASGCAVAAYAVLWVLGATVLQMFGVRRIEVGDYVFALIYVAMAWPLYMLALWVATRHRPERFRRWALGLFPLLGVMLGIGNLLVNQPEIQAVYVFYLLYGTTVRPPQPLGHGQRTLGAQTHSHA